MEIELINMEKRKLKIQQELNNLDLQMIDSQLQQFNSSEEREKKLPNIKKGKKKSQVRKSVNKAPTFDSVEALPKSKKIKAVEKFYPMPQ